MNALPMHTISSSWIDKKVINSYQSLAKNYFWGSCAKKKNFHLIGRNKIMLTKSIGGLGIKDLEIMRFSTHACRILPFLNKGSSLWAKLLNKKYQDYHPWSFKKYSNLSWSFKCIHSAIQ
ncbi:hypothetical protein Cni_G25797 [Canna indica]|uniref:Uncharacterized protein n=1 Tax=Canna indica TaxID=4628 RepID=A0AAQ3QMS1_9LILI|nr:hypothetical protein Cni_G25797 [Canna indica]